MSADLRDWRRHPRSGSPASSSDAMTRVHMSCEWHEPEAPQGVLGARIAHERANPDDPMRESRFEGRPMSVDASPRRSRVADHEQHTHPRRPPPVKAGDRSGEPDLAIDGHECALDVWYDGLDLRDEDRPASGMPGEDIHGPSFSTDCEGRLGYDLPLMTPEQRNDLVHEVGVAGVKQAVNGLAVPVEANGRACAQGFGDLLDRPAGHASAGAVLEP